MRQLVSSGSPFEGEIGFSRAVRVGAIVEVAGTAPIGATATDVYTQTKRCFEIIALALKDASAELKHVTRTRIMLTDIAQWRDAARAHGEVFRDIKPACTFVEVSGFIDPAWKVEIEVSAVVE